jgi:hypothetical protein
MDISSRGRRPSVDKDGKKERWRGDEIRVEKVELSHINPCQALLIPLIMYYRKLKFKFIV